MQTCECCGREYKGVGGWCANCNSHGRFANRNPDRSSRGPQETGAMEYTEERERNEDSGWPYEDGSRDELSEDRKQRF